MNTGEINRILSVAAKGVFTGTFAADKLPKKPSKPFAVVINYDNHDLPGSHWVCIYADENNTHYHDSFGLPPFRMEIPQFIDPETYTMTAKQLQNKRSTVCGHHVIAFIVSRFLGMSTATFLSRFGDDTRQNDRIVYEYVSGIKGNLSYRCMSNLSVKAIIINHPVGGELFVSVTKGFLLIQLAGLEGGNRFIVHPSNSKDIVTYHAEANFDFYSELESGIVFRIRQNTSSIVIEISNV